MRYARSTFCRINSSHLRTRYYYSLKFALAGAWPAGELELLDACCLYELAEGFDGRSTEERAHCSALWRRCVFLLLDQFFEGVVVYAFSAIGIVMVVAGLVFFFKGRGQKTAGP